MTTPFNVSSNNKNRTIRVKVDDYELRKLLGTFSRMDDIAKNDMKKIANDLAERAAKFVTAYAYNAPNPAQADAIMKSLKINRSDKAPNFTMGGNKRVTRSGAKAGTLIFGTEFGAYQDRPRKRKGKSTNYVGYRQFPPRSRRKGRGNRGWFIFIALERFQPVIVREWLQGYEKIANEWKGRAA
jgi:hypothetical protein